MIDPNNSDNVMVIIKERDSVPIALRIDATEGFVFFIQGSISILSLTISFIKVSMLRMNIAYLFEHRASYALSKSAMRISQQCWPISLIYLATSANKFVNKFPNQFVSA